MTMWRKLVTGTVSQLRWLYLLALWIRSLTSMYSCSCLTPVIASDNWPIISLSLSWWAPGKQEQKTLWSSSLLWNPQKLVKHHLSILIDCECDSNNENFSHPNKDMLIQATVLKWTLPYVTVAQFSPHLPLYWYLWEALQGPWKTWLF